MKFKDFFIITRAWSLTITFISVTAGTALAWQEGRSSLKVYLITLLGAMLFHAGANTLNDYFDLKNKVDTPDAPTALYRPHPVFANFLTERELLFFSALLLASSLVIGIFLAVLRTPLVWIFMLAGFRLAFLYSGGPSGLKYNALGEVVVFLAFGPLMIEGAYVVQTGSVSWKTFYISVPLGLMTSLILFANNLRDRTFDAKSGIKTLCTILGPGKSLMLHTILSVSPFVFICIYIYSKILSWPAMLAFLSLPPIMGLNKEFRKKVPLTADAVTSQLALFFGLLLLAALFVEKLPHL